MKSAPPRKNITEAYRQPTATSCNCQSPTTTMQQPVVRHAAYSEEMNAAAD
jgi:hypothetical protein